MIESVTSSGCQVWLLKREGQRKVLGLEMDCLKRSARLSRLQKISQTPQLGTKCKQTINFRQNSKKASEMVWTPP